MTERKYCVLNALRVEAQPLQLQQQLLAVDHPRAVVVEELEEPLEREHQPVPLLGREHHGGGELLEVDVPVAIHVHEGRELLERLCAHLAPEVVGYRLDLLAADHPALVPVVDLEDRPQVQQDVGRLLVEELLPLHLDELGRAPVQKVAAVDQLQAEDDLGEGQQDRIEPPPPLLPQHLPHIVVLPQLLGRCVPVVHEERRRGEHDRRDRRKHGEVLDEGKLLRQLHALEEDRLKGEEDDAVEEQELHAGEIVPGAVGSDAAEEHLVVVARRSAEGDLEDGGPVDEVVVVELLVKLEVGRGLQPVVVDAVLGDHPQARHELVVDYRHLHEVPQRPDDDGGLREEEDGEETDLVAPVPELNLSDPLQQDHSDGKRDPDPGELLGLDGDELPEVLGGVVLEVGEELEVLGQQDAVPLCLHDEPLPEPQELGLPDLRVLEQLAQQELHTPDLLRARDGQASMHDHLLEDLVVVPEREVPLLDLPADPDHEHRARSEERDRHREEAVVQGLELLEQQLGLSQVLLAEVREPTVLSSDLEGPDQQADEAQGGKLREDLDDDGAHGQGKLLLHVVLEHVERAGEHQDR
eukprot:747347-Hanusia_phi.AAC.2